MEDPSSSRKQKAREESPASTSSTLSDTMGEALHNLYRLPEAPPGRSAPPGLPLDVEGQQLPQNGWFSEATNNFHWVQGATMWTARKGKEIRKQAEEAYKQAEKAYKQAGKTYERAKKETRKQAKEVYKQAEKAYEQAGKAYRQAEKIGKDVYAWGRAHPEESKMILEQAFPLGVQGLGQGLKSNTVYGVGVTLSGLSGAAGLGKEAMKALHNYRHPDQPQQSVSFTRAGASAMQMGGAVAHGFAPTQETRGVGASIQSVATIAMAATLNRNPVPRPESPQTYPLEEVVTDRQSQSTQYSQSDYSQYSQSQYSQSQDAASQSSDSQHWDYQQGDYSPVAASPYADYAQWSVGNAPVAQYSQSQYSQVQFSSWQAPATASPYQQSAPYAGSSATATGHQLETSDHLLERRKTGTDKPSESKSKERDPSTDHRHNRSKQQKQQKQGNSAGAR